jgi:hypothetical protein
MHGFELEARSGDIPVDYNKCSDLPIRGSVAISRVHTGERRVDRDRLTNHLKKHPTLATTAIWLCEDREYLAANAG